jgi:hypothetical protein
MASKKMPGMDEMASFCRGFLVSGKNQSNGRRVAFCRAFLVAWDRRKG